MLKKENPSGFYVDPFKARGQFILRKYRKAKSSINQ